MEKSFFSSDGRITRKTFWLRWLALIGANTASQIVVGSLESTATTSGSTVALISSLLGLVAWCLLIIQNAKRLHDVGKSGWYQLVPFYNLILYCTAGTPGPNRYGEDPLGGAQPVAGLVKTFE